MSKAERKSKVSTTSHAETVAYDVAEHLRTPKEMAAYLDAWLEDAPVDAVKIARAQGNIARAKGVTPLARECQPVVSITS